MATPKVYITSENDFGKCSARLISSTLQAQNQIFHIISLSGGSTPWPVYTQLSPSLAVYGDLRRFLFIQTDERLVAPASDRSNQAAIRKSLLNGQQPGDRMQFIAAPVEAEDVCSEYARLLSAHVPSGRWPETISLAVLGIGPDGHIASLFPDTAWENADSSSGFIIVNSASQPETRISLSFSAIMQAREIVFLVTGKTKQAILDEVVLNPESTLPAAKLIRDRQVMFSVTEDAVSPKLFQYLNGQNCISHIRG